MVSRFFPYYRGFPFLEPWRDCSDDFFKGIKVPGEKTPLCGEKRGT